jgi:alkylhydroperoxidase family enzyme
MQRIRPLDRGEVSVEMQAAWDQQVAAHGRMTNMKRTLAHSPPAFRALMEWYTLRDEVLPFLGPRAVNLFSHAISTQTDCLICSTFFRRLLIEAGENPDRLQLDDREAALVAYGRQLARDPNGVGDALFQELERHFSPPQLVSLTAFGAMMVATNVLNNALRVPLDDYLVPYRTKGTGEKR